MDNALHIVRRQIIKNIYQVYNNTWYTFTEIYSVYIGIYVMLSEGKHNNNIPVCVSWVGSIRSTSIVQILHTHLPLCYCIPSPLLRRYMVWSNRPLITPGRRYHLLF